MWGERESLTANDNDLISVSLKIIRAPSSGRGRRAKRGGVGFPECGSTVSRGQPPALRATSFQRKEGEVVKTIYSLPVEGGCPKGRGLAKGEKERSQPPALRATSFQRKEGECRLSCIVISSGSEKSFSFAVRQKL